MNTNPLHNPARKLLSATFVALVAATCLGSATSTSSASAGHDRAAVVSATDGPAGVHVTSRTKEWRPVPTESRTKEWSVASTVDKTKEW